MLLNSRPQSPATDPKALLYAFKIAIDGIDQDAVVKTCRRFIRGEVEDDDRRYAPSSAEFAKQCRDQQAADEYARRPKLSHNPEPQHSDEHRAMMLKRMAEFSKTLANGHAE